MRLANGSIRPILAIAVVCHCAAILADDVAAPPSTADRPRVLLDGNWDFRLDPTNEGEAQQWWSVDSKYPETILVPGTWQAQGFGPPIGIVKHNYQGHAWYRRSVTVPNGWQGRRVWLRFEGVCNNGDAYLNGRKIGHIDTFITPYEFDVTDLVQFDRENVLAVMVDSGSTEAVQRSQVSPLSPESAAGYLGMMQMLGKWGGITSHVWLEARPDPALEEILLRPNLAAQEVVAELRLKRHATGAAWNGRAAVRVAPLRGEGGDHRADVAIRFQDQAAESEPAVVAVKIPGLHPWSPDDPFLYRVTVELTGPGGAGDLLTLRTGFRELVADKATGDFVLSGKPLFLCGVGYDSLEPITGAPTPDKQVYVERLRLLKQYGFNYVRFLAHTPLPEFFEAADEVGILVQAEGEWFAGWDRPMLQTTAALFAAQVPRIIREHRHHPSWYAFSCFNEAVGANGDPIRNGYIQAAYKAFRTMDPKRFFIASDGGLDQWPTDVITDHFNGIMDKADQPDPNPSEARPTEVFHGALDEAVLFDKAVSAESMQPLAAVDDAASYRTKLAAMQPIAHWPLDDKGAPGKVDRALICGIGDQQTPGLVLAEQAEELISKMQNAFTISLWAKPEPVDAGVFGNLFSCGAAVPGGALLLTYRGDGHIVVGRYGTNILTSKETLRTGEWNHVGLTWDGRRIQLFLDGRPDSEVEALFALPASDMALGRLIERGARGPAEYRSRPHVWHEFNNTYIAPLPDLDIEKRLTGALTQSWVLEPHRRRLEAYGLLARYADLRKRSLDLYRNYVKWIFEDARRLPRLDGYAWWGTTNDIPAGVETDVSSLSVLDMLYQPEKFVFEEFRKFNRESVLMIDADIDGRVLAAGESRPLKVSLSHFGADAVRNGRVLWKISSDTNVLQEGVLAPINAESTKITELGSIPLGPIECSKPMVLRVQVDLESDACRQSNDWTFWVFPKKKQGMPTAKMCNLTGEPSIGDRYGASGPDSLPQADLVFARRLTPEVLEYLRTGGRVILLAQDAERAAVHLPKVISQVVAAEMATTQERGFLTQPGTLGYWARWIRCNAQIVENHAALGDFPHDGFCDYQLMRLYGRMTPSVDLTPADSPARTKVRPIIWALDLAPWSAEASPFGVVMTWHAMLSECRVEKGRAILCTLYVLDGVKNGLPEAGYLLDCLVNHACSDRFEPSTPPFSLEEARQFFKNE